MVLTALILAAAIAQQDTYALLWKPKKGEKSIYEFYLDGAESSIGGSIEASIEYVVESVSADGSYSVKSRSLGAVLRTQGQEIRDDRVNESTAKFGYSGDLIEITKGVKNLERYRQALLTRFVAPPASVRVSESWSYERKSDSPRGLGACKIDYRILSVVDGQARVSFKLSFKNPGEKSPMNASGDWWIDTATGQVLRMSAKVENYLGKLGAKSTVRISRVSNDPTATVHN